MLLQLTDKRDAAVMGVVDLYKDACVYRVSQSDNRTIDEAVTTYQSSSTSSIYSTEITSLLDQLIAEGTASELSMLFSFR